MNQPRTTRRLRRGRTLAREVIKEVRPKRMAIDSLNHLEMYIPRDNSLRREIYRILQYAKTKGVSPMLLWDAQHGTRNSFSVAEAGMSFLVDCIILLKFVEIESSMKKAMAVMKMRGSDHDKQLR